MPDEKQRGAPAAAPAASQIRSCTDFVRSFHADLTKWFSGEGDESEVWASLGRAAPDDMVLVYPSGTVLSGAAFLESIRQRFASSPGFVASVSECRVVVESPDHATVAYVETQTGARSSTVRNRRSALAVVSRTPAGWAWRYIQETAMPDPT